MLKANSGSQEADRVNTSTEGIIPSQMMNPRGDGLMNKKKSDWSGGQAGISRVGHNMAMQRIDLSKLHGENPRNWIRKCKNFFKLNYNIPVQQWVELASLYLDGKAKIWFEGFLYAGENLAIWEEFTRALCIRFGNGENVVEELNKLAQDKSVDEYVERFEELKSLMNALIPF
jgi:hypothetical protein